MQLAKPPNSSTLRSRSLDHPEAQHREMCPNSAVERAGVTPRRAAARLAAPAAHRDRYADEGVHSEVD